MIYVGTSGYSYQDWIGPFYPHGMVKGDMLPFYSQTFSFTEINSTYYQMPNFYAVRQWDLKTPDSFLFMVKAHGSMTHSRDAGRDEFKKFCDAMGPLRDKDKLAGLLFQFPYSFHFGTEEMDYLRRIRDYIPDDDIYIEYRNDQWICQVIFDLMKELQFGFVCVDEPDIKGLVKPIVVSTNSKGYIRFHGRNKIKWYNHQRAYERYDYLYTEDELEEWIPKIQRLEKYAEKLYITFNNHFRAQGVINGKMLQNLLEKGSPLM